MSHPIAQRTPHRSPSWTARIGDNGIVSARCSPKYAGRFVFDYHVHTTCSVDCVTPIESSCQAAIDHGVTEIAFTDHVDHQPADEGFGFYKPEVYFESVDRMREKYGDRLTILYGAEVDYHDDTRPEVERFMRAYGHRYDFVIGSVHYGNNGQIIFPDYFD